LSWKNLKTQPKKKKLRSHKHFQQSSRIQNQYTKISSISIYKQWTVRETNQENTTIYNSFKNIKIPMNKFDKGHDRPIQWKLQVTKERKQQRYPMLTYQWNQYCENVYTTKKAIPIKFYAISIKMPMTHPPSRQKS
jgi:hypothetical protein